MMATDYAGNLSQAIRDAQSGDRQAMEHCLSIIEDPLKRLVSTYGKFSDRTGQRVNHQELFNEAIVKILEAFSNFQPDPSKTDEGVRSQYIAYFLTTTKPIIRSACHRATRTIDMPDWAVKYAPRIQRAIDKVAMEQGASFSYSKLDPETIAMRSGAPLSRVKLFLKKQLGRHSSGLFTNWDEVVASCSGGSSPSSLTGSSLDFLNGEGVAEESSIEEALLSEESKKLIARSWKYLKERHKQVLALRYGMNTDPMSRGEIANTLGLTTAQVRKAESDGLEVIREYLEGSTRPIARAGA